MSEGFDECKDKCEHWDYCDWSYWCGNCDTCPAYLKFCTGIGNDKCYLSKQMYFEERREQ